MLITQVFRNRDGQLKESMVITLCYFPTLKIEHCTVPCWLFTDRTSLLNQPLGGLKGFKF